MVDVPICNILMSMQKEAASLYAPFGGCVTFGIRELKNIEMLNTNINIAVLLISVTYGIF